MIAAELTVATTVPLATRGIAQMSSSPPSSRPRTGRHTSVTRRFRSRCVGAAAVAGLLLFGCAVEAPPPLTGAMHFYIEAQEALAADDFEAAAAAVRTLQNLVGAEEADVAKNAASSTDIEQLRQAFKPLSEAFVMRDVPTGYDIAYCTMVDDDRGGRWIQKKGAISNPYFGSSMPGCGAFESDEGVFEPDDGAAEAEGY